MPRDNQTDSASFPKDESARGQNMAAVEPCTKRAASPRRFSLFVKVPGAIFDGAITAGASLDS
jgi:hypothetical protein